MYRSVLAAGILLSILSCSGYISQHTDNSEQMLGTLAIGEGGGYLSGPSNDISPFLFRDTNGLNPVLFFSSDRDGSYDIYRAALNPDGTFQPPVKLGPDINTDLSNEMYPLVSYYPYGPSLHLYITFVRESAADHHIVTAYVDADFTVTNQSSYYFLGSISSLSLETTNYYDNLFVYNSYGGGSFYSRSFQWWDFAYPYSINDSFLNDAYAAAIRYDELSDGQDGYWWKERIILAERDGTATRQLYLFYAYEGFFPYRLQQQAYPVSQYASRYNDRWPVVDYRDQGRVYFASDRGVNGDFDLFRYNEQNYFAILPLNPYK